MNIQILGPAERNAMIARHLSSDHRVRLSNEVVTLDQLKAQSIDFIVSNGYGPILKAPITSAYRKRIVNIHPAALPNGRGIYPNFWSFFEQFSQEATIHYIDDGIDTGDVLLRERIEVSSGDTLRQVLTRLLKTAENLFISNSKAILGGELQGISQENLGFSSFYHSRLVSEYFVELLSNGWDTPVEEIIDMGDSWALSADLILACSSGMKSVER